MSRPVQFLIIHDHTASMGGFRVHVQAKHCQTVRDLFAFAKGKFLLQVAVHSIYDRHDVPGERDFKELLFTSDMNEVIKHIQNVPNAIGNSSWEECYERSIHRARELNWLEDAIKIVSLTGDSEPHPVNHFKNPEGFDWQKETRALVQEQNVKLYPVYCQTSGTKAPFWDKIKTMGGGICLNLDEFAHITPLFIGIIAKECGGFENFEKDYGAVNSIPYAVQRSFDLLAGRQSKAYKSVAGTAAEGRFQPYVIDQRIPVDQFFVELGIIESREDYKHHKGELFYAHDKRSSEEIRPNHEVVVINDQTGQKFVGITARDMINIPYGAKGHSIPRNYLSARGYTIYIQSKSVGNARHLEPGQRVLIDLRPEDGFGDSPVNPPKKLAHV